MTRTVALLWRLASHMLPARRRDWGEAFGAEMEQVPPGRARVVWMIGGLRLVVREAHLAMKLAYVGVATVAFASILEYGWDAGPTPGTAIHRTVLIATMSMLAVVPWVSARLKAFGPMADGVGPRLVRICAFAAMWAVLPVAIYVGNYADRRFGTCADCTAADRAQWHAERINSAVSGSIAIFVVLTAYAVLILWMTSRRSPGTSTTLAIGGTVGLIGGAVVYALAPVGNPLHVANSAVAAILDGTLLFTIPAVPFVASMLAARRAGAAKSADSGDIAVVQGIVAGVVAGAIGVLLLAVLTIPTMVRFPHDVRLEWANPDPNVAHGTPFEVQMSVSDAAQRYEIFLVLGPLLGAAIGLGGGTAAYGLRARRPDAPTPASTSSWLLRTVTRTFPS